MGTVRTSAERARRRTAPLAVLLVVVLLLGAVGAFAPGAARGAAIGCSNVSAKYGVNATVTWNGVNVCSGGSASSAFSVDLTQSIGLRYNWSGPVGHPLSLNDARLQMFYFGFPLATRDVTTVGGVQGPSGSFVMNWTPGVIAYVLEGLYGLTASLLATNGTTVFSEGFFVHANAPYGILAALPILLIVLGIYEVYNVARSGRQAALPKTAKPPGPPPPPESGAGSGPNGAGTPPPGEGGP